MSTRKRPLNELSNTPFNTQTPRRYAPSTPHAIRALQQRSGAKSARSLRTRKIAQDAASSSAVDPASARGVLRRFAKLTAPTTRPLLTPASAAGKENVRPIVEEEEEEDERMLKKPRMTFDIDESLEEGSEEEPPVYEEEDSDMPVAPTPSMLPDKEEGDATITFQSINFDKDGLRRNSRMSLPATEAEIDADATIMTERGRRALTEDATGRLSRYSFGSIRMSDFGTELENPDDSIMNGRLSEVNAEMRRKSAMPAPILDATDLSSLMQQPADVDDDDDEPDNPAPFGDDDDFQLEVPRDEDVTTVMAKDSTHPFTQPEEDGWEDIEEQDPADEYARLSPKSKRDLTALQSANAKQETGRRKRRVKMTKHGTLVPSLPSSLIKKIATEVHVRNGRRKPVFGPEHTKALEQATEWFFEQVGEDLAAYSSHGRRKRRIDSEDVFLLMRRQRLFQNPGELRKFAKTWLPKEVRATLDLPDVP